MIKRILSAIAIVALSGCTTVYTYNGQKYESKERFHQAVDSTLSDALATITPLAAPLTKKKLLFAFPTEAALVTVGIENFVKVQGKEPNAASREMLENVTKANYRNNRVFFDAIQKKNIFASTQFLDMQTTSGSFEPSSDTDTMYYIEPRLGSGQWYYASFKNGKQIFASDRSSPTPAGKVQAFVDAVQAQAIRD